MTGEAYGLWLGLLTCLVVGGWIVHRQFEGARRERRQIISAIDFLEKELVRLRERLPLSEDQRAQLSLLTKSKQPDRDTDFK